MKFNLGEKISVKLSEILIKSTNKNDVEMSAKKCNISYSLLKKIKYRQANVTVNNKNAVIYLMTVAFTNNAKGIKINKELELFL